jgi:hypothetical protein
VEPKVEPDPEPKTEPKVGKKKKKGKAKKEAVVKGDPTVEPKVVPKECCNVRIDSVPSGASLFIDGLKKGTTPYVVKLARGARLSVKLAKGGWQDKSVTITASDNETKRIPLVKVKTPFGMPGSDPGIKGGDNPL